MGEEEGKKKQITESRLEEALRSRLSYFYEHAKSLNMSSVRRMLEEDLGIEKSALDVHKRFIKQFVDKNVVENSGKNSGSTAEVKEEAKDCEKDEKLKKAPSSKAETGSREEESSNETKFGVANVQNTDISESSIKKAILERADHFNANSKTLQLVSARRLLEGDLGLQINALDPFKKFISREVVEVVATAKASESSFDSSMDISEESPRGSDGSESSSKPKASKKSKKDAAKKSVKEIDSDEDSESSEPKSSRRTKKDATRRSSVVVHPKAPRLAPLEKNSNLQYRFAMKGICDIYEKIHNDLRQEHLDLLDRTPFRLLFKALYEKRICRKRRNDDVLEQVILSYDPEKKQFKIGKRYSKIYKSEIRLIFGIQDGKIKVVYNKGPVAHPVTAFTERNFHGAKQVTTKMIKDLIVKVVVKTDEDSVQDTVRLLCLLLFQSCFFTTTGTILGWAYVKYVEDLSKLNSYDWTHIIHKYLIDGLDKKSKSPRKVNGCVLALWYWFCERCKTIKPKEDEVAIPNDKDMEYKGIPRATKWVMSDLEKVFRKSKLSEFKEDEFSWNKLTPTKAELKLMPNTPKDKQSEQTQRHETEDDDDSDLEVLPPMRKCTNAADSSSRKKVKHILKDELSGKNKTQESEDDHDSAFQELTPKKKRANAVESSSSRKKGKHTAHNDDQENMKEEREIPQKTQEDVDSVIQENEIPQDPFQDLFQEMFKEHGNVSENNQWLDSREDNNQVVMDTLEALTVTETLKDLPTGSGQIQVNQSPQTKDLDPREEEMQRRELEIQILKSQIVSLNSTNNQLLMKMKRYEDQEKAKGNELAERAAAMEQVVSLKTKNEQLEKDREEEMKTLRTKLNEMEVIVVQIQRQLASNENVTRLQRS